MIPIQNFYTGTNAGVVLPDTPKTDRAIKDYYDKQFEMSKIQLAKAERDQKMFLNFNKVEPMKALTQKQQAEDLMDITAFQKQMKKIQSKPGGPTTVDYMESQNAMTVLKSKQNLRQANNELYLKELDIISKSPDEYDTDYWGNNQMQYFNDSTKYNTGLVPRKIDLGLFAAKAASYGKPAKSNKTFSSVEGGVITSEKDESYDVTDPQMYNNYKVSVLSDYKAHNTAIREFAELPLDKQKGYHDKADANNDGKLDPNEMDNAIMLASIDLHKDKFNKVISVAEGSKPTGKGYIIFNNGFSLGKDNKNVLDYSEDVSSAMGASGKGIEVVTKDIPYMDVPAEDITWSDPEVKFPEGAQVRVQLARIIGDRGVAELTPDVAKIKNIEVTTTNISETPTNYTINKGADGKPVSYTYTKAFPSNVTAEAKVSKIKKKLDAAFDGKFSSYYDKLFPTTKEAKYIIPNFPGSFTEKDLRSRGWKDADIAKLKQE